MRTPHQTAIAASVISVTRVSCPARTEQQVELELRVATTRRVRALLAEASGPYMSKTKGSSSDEAPDEWAPGKTCCIRCRNVVQASYLASHYKRVHDEEIKHVLVCDRCGTTFMNPIPDRQYCSEECAWKAKKDGTDVATTICAQCGDEFTHLGRHDRMYCSQQCYYDSISPDLPTEGSENPEDYTEVYELLEGNLHRDKVARRLVEAGYETETDLREADPEDLHDINGIGKGTINQICRALDEPWPTPWSRGPGTLEEEEQEEQNSRSTPSTKKSGEQSRSGGDDGGSKNCNPLAGKDALSCPFCGETIPKDGFRQHVKECDEA